MKFAVKLGAGLSWRLFREPMRIEFSRLVDFARLSSESRRWDFLAAFLCDFGVESWALFSGNLARETK